MRSSMSIDTARICEITLRMNFLAQENAVKPGGPRSFFFLTGGPSPAETLDGKEVFRFSSSLVSFERRQENMLLSVSSSRQPDNLKGA